MGWVACSCCFDMIPKGNRAPYIKRKYQELSCHNLSLFVIGKVT